MILYWIYWNSSTYDKNKVENLSLKKTCAEQFIYVRWMALSRSNFDIYEATINILSNFGISFFIRYLHTHKSICIYCENRTQLFLVVIPIMPHLLPLSNLPLSINSTFHLIFTLQSLRRAFKWAMTCSWWKME